MRTSVFSIPDGDWVAGLIRSMVTSIADTPSAVKVDAIVEGDVTLDRVQVANSEIGQVIGKQGRRGHCGRYWRPLQ